MSIPLTSKKIHSKKELKQFLKDGIIELNTYDWCLKQIKNGYKVSWLDLSMASMAFKKKGKWLDMDEINMACSFLDDNLENAIREVQKKCNKIYHAKL